MRARFASDVAIAESCDENEPKTEPLEARIDDFKRDSQNMEVMEGFVDDVLQKAEKEAIKKQEAEAAAAAKSNGKASQQAKEKLRQSFAIPDFKNGKVVNRARGLVVRIFDAICNCANSAAAPAQRIKLRGKRAAAAAAAAAANKEENVENKEGETEKRSEKQQPAQEQENKPESKQPPVVVTVAPDEEMHK